MLKIISNRKGIALIATYVIITVLVVSAGPFFWRSFNEFRFAQRQKDLTKAYYATEAALAEATMQIYQAFNTPATRPYQAWKKGIKEYEKEFKDVLGNFSFPLNGNIDDLTYSVVLPSKSKDQIVRTADGLLLRVVVTATVPHLGGTVRKAVATSVAYEMKPSPIFSYGYFVNNPGSLKGKGIIVNGDVRANGNFSFNNNPRVNGEIYAAENPVLETAGTVSGGTNYWDIAEYQENAPAEARPTNPTGTPNPGGEVYDTGYDGESNNFEHQSVLDMPYLGDLAGYERLAKDKDINGRITQGGEILFEGVYDGKGPDGTKNTPDDGCIVLIGTDEAPIVIEGHDSDGNPVPGVVVIEKDLIIKGVISGQGTIYAGRNIHILANVEYEDSPSWPKPDPAPPTTAEANKAKDFVAFAAKGNVVIGDYTGWKNSYKETLNPPATQAYEVDETDAALGYDTDGDSDNGYWFDGDYTAYDGGYKMSDGGTDDDDTDDDGTDDGKKDKKDKKDKKKDDGGGDSLERRFYESSLSDKYIKDNADNTKKITQIDGVFFNNHAFAGEVGNCTFNGSIISRDEAMTFDKELTINYDVRANRRGNDYIDIYLPRSLVLPETRARQSG